MLFIDVSSTLEDAVAVALQSKKALRRQRQHRHSQHRQTKEYLTNDNRNQSIHHVSLNTHINKIPRKTSHLEESDRSSTKVNQIKAPRRHTFERAVFNRNIEEQRSKSPKRQLSDKVHRKRRRDAESSSILESFHDDEKHYRSTKKRKHPTNKNNIKNNHNHNNTNQDGRLFDMKLTNVDHLVSKIQIGHVIDGTFKLEPHMKNALLSEMFTWTKFHYLNKIEQEILWLTQVSRIIIDTFTTESKNNAQNKDSIDTEKLTLQLIQNLMSTQLHSKIKAWFEMENQVMTKSLLVRKGIRLFNQRVKYELVEKQKMAKGKITEILESAKMNPNERYGKCQKRLSKVNCKWLHKNIDREDCRIFQPGEKVALFKQRYTGSSLQESFHLECFPAAILGCNAFIEGNEKTNYFPYLYSVMLSNSTVELGVIPQSIFTPTESDEFKSWVNSTYI
jgi:hypothetical protein